MADTDTATLTMDSEGDGWFSKLSDNEMIGLFAAITVIFALTLFFTISAFLFGLFPGQNRCENPGCRKRCRNVRWIWDDEGGLNPKKPLGTALTEGYAVTRIHHHDGGKCDYRSLWQMIKSKKGSVKGDTPFSLVPAASEPVTK